MQRGRMPALPLRWNAWWQARLPREQQILIVGAVLIVLTLAWLLLWQPAARGITQLNNELPALRSQNATLQAMASEAGQLRAGTVPAASLPEAERLTALQQSLEAAGIAAQTSSAGQGRIQVSIAALDYAAWVSWLASAETGMGARTERVEVKALPPPAAAGQVQVKLMLNFTSQGAAK